MKRFTKTGSFISSKIGRAIKDYELIEAGDRILMGVSLDTNRKYLKGFIKNMEKRCPSVKTNIFKSIGRVKADHIDLKL